MAAAANLTETFARIGPAFQAETGIEARFSFGSTAQLARQIENGAPYDVFAAADTAHVDQLEKKGLLAAGSRAVYARGVLSVWIPSGKPVSDLSDLTRPEFRVIAIAKPELAPYGAAAVEALHRARVWDALEPRIIYAENINMARQYGKANNADAVFTAWSLVLGEGGSKLEVPAGLYPPIEQALGIPAASKNAAAARRFAGYLISGRGREILKASGYR